MDVQRIAQLAMLHLEEEELPRFAADMEAITAMVQQLPTLEELADMEEPMPLREDIAASEMIPRETLLPVSQQHPDGYVIVPKTVGQG